VHDVGDGVDIERRDVAPFGDAGVVDQEVDAAEGIDHIHTQLVHRVEIGQVDHPHPALRRVLHAPLHDLGQPLTAPRADADDGSRGSQRLRQAGPDARRAARDQGATPVQVHSHR
jgi:hypothetical protein